MTASQAQAAPGLGRRIAQRLADALPSARVALVGTGLWALVNGATAAIGLLARDWQDEGAVAIVGLVFAAGAAIAFVPATYLARIVSLGSRTEIRLAAALLALSVATIAATALVFALQYRLYYAQWHADFPSITWGFQQFFTTAAAVYQFAVLGLRLYFPIGFLAIFPFAGWIARQAR